jgi:transposase
VSANSAIAARADLPAVEEALKAGASVVRVARAHGVNANQVFHWRKLYDKRGLLEVEHERAELLPVKIVEAR